MPKISELPPSDPLGGPELVAVVQDGETRQADLHQVVIRAAGGDLRLDNLIVSSSIASTHLGLSGDLGVGLSSTFHGPLRCFGPASFEGDVQAAATPPDDSSDFAMATTEFVARAVARVSDGSSNAAPGRIGEFLSAQSPPPGIEITGPGLVPVVNLDLTPGDWDLNATCGFQINGLPPAPSPIYLVAAITEGPGFPGFPNEGGVTALTVTPSGSDITLPVTLRLLTPVPTSRNILIHANGFAPWRCFAYGFLSARRRR